MGPVALTLPLLPRAAAGGGGGEGGGGNGGGGDGGGGEGRGGDGKFLIEENVVFDKESLVSALRYIGLPHTHTCQPAAGGTPSIPLPSSS